jgi:N-acetylglutamate synthase-like GNAT family acetyltransferase
LKKEVRFRAYEPKDCEACLAIYRKNEPGRFPSTHGPKFVEYLQKDAKSFLVAEHHGRVVGYGGIDQLGTNVATLCYGIVDPEFQRQRIGTALVLLRMAQVPSGPVGALFLIFAVDASMPVYRRFGFIEKTKWKSEDGKEHPVGVLQVFPDTHARVKSVLRRRRLHIDGNFVLQPSREAGCEILIDASGCYQIQLRPPGSMIS